MSSSSTRKRPPSVAVDPDEYDGDELINDLAALERLRQNVHQNLRLRPLRTSTTNISDSRSSPTWFSRDDVASPTSPASVYFTPTSDSPLTTYFGLTSPPDLSFPQLKSPSRPHPFHYSSLQSLLLRSPRPLLIDTRPINAFLLSHLQHSVNVAIPSLILKRCRKPSAGFQSIDSLRQYITTERGKQVWDDTINNGHWNGNVLIFDEDMDEKLKSSMQSTAWVLLHTLPPLLNNGRADYLEGGLSSVRSHPSLQYLFMSGDSSSPLDQRQSQSQKQGGLFQLDTLAAVRSKQFPQIEQPSDSPHSPTTSSRTPVRSWTVDSVDSSSPSPQSIVPSHQPTRRPSVPTLRKLDTHALPKLSLKTQMSKSATVSSGPKMPWHGNPSPLKIIPLPPSSSHLNSSFPPSIIPPLTSPLPFSNSSNRFLSTTPTPSQPSSPHTPHTPMPPSPITARPEDNEQPLTEESFPVFTISTILPHFLFLGPELTSEEHVQELKDLGVKRILNIAAECDDDQGLNLKSRFDNYIKIPMRDTVEEENIKRGVREVCDILDDARLHSSPTYIHCKAGKSRSVTAVIGYLIHANHWTLTRAYSFVLERRKGISPNIGFVSELMNFEEEELGGKSVGVVNVDLEHPSEGGHSAGSVSAGAGSGGGSRRPTNLRESLPPTFSPHPYSFGGTDGEGPGPDIGDSGQEMEIRDASGRYRHARRAPVDEMTLQPMRRVSKAGLESAGFHEMGGQWG